MKNKLIIFFIAIVVMVVAFLLINIMKIEKTVVPVRFGLSEKTGFDLNPQELSFGNIQINQSATRDILVSNNFKRKVKITVESRGEISENIIVSENNFYLNPEESKNITFTVYTKGLTEFREYLGEVIIISKKA